MSISIGVGILTVSDSASLDSSLDRSGPLLRDLLTQPEQSNSFAVIKAAIVPDDKDAIAKTVMQWAALPEIDWIITTGGTGFGVRDCTPEAIAPLLSRPASGLTHLLLSTSLQHTPLASLSRPVAGTISTPSASSPSPNATHETLVVTLPGSPKAVKENMSALLGAGVVLHAIELMKGGKDAGKAVHQSLGVSDRYSHRLGNSQHAHHHSHHQHHQHHSHHHDHVAPVPKSHDPSLGAPSRHRVSPYPLLKLEDALAIVQREIQPLEVITKMVDPSLAGHILAETVLAPHDLPLSPTTNVDGYAIDASLAPGTYPVLTPRTFSLSTSGAVPKDHIYRINTGSPLPQGTNAVVMVEDTELSHTPAPMTSDIDGTEDEAEVQLLVGASEGENVRLAGSDVRRGEVVLERGCVLGAGGGEIGTLAFVGKTEVKVHRKPIVGLMSTGNEIIDLQGLQQQAGSDGGQGRDGWTGTFDTNRPSLAAVLRGMGYEVIDFGIVGDQLTHTTTMRQALSQTDLLITTGGSSMGSSDLLKPVIERHLGGTVHFGRVAVKPGKPTTFASVPAPSQAGDNGAASNHAGVTEVKPVFALPGNPASALVMFYIFVVPALRKLGGWADERCALPRVPVQIMDSMPLDPRPEFHRVHVRVGPAGLRAYSTGGQRSSRMASLAGANGLVALPAKAGKDEVGGKVRLEKGEMATAVLVGELEPELA
ncbi:hypothetical protein DL93DRAFT_2149060 [Clavulina sp. PMI_390]|nr:hypothetical protein DL93DRAFT_2149060 [Clavulina sp. PMI_390]